MNSISLLQDMAELSRQMVQAAEANAWDTLTELEKRQAGLRDRLIAGGIESETLSGEALSVKEQLLREMLANDEIIRRHVVPWLDSTRKLLQRGTKGRAMRNAYSAMQR